MADNEGTIIVAACWELKCRLTSDPAEYWVDVWTVQRFSDENEGVCKILPDRHGTVSTRCNILVNNTYMLYAPVVWVNHESMSYGVVGQVLFLFSISTVSKPVSNLCWLDV